MAKNFFFNFCIEISKMFEFSCVKNYAKKHEDSKGIRRPPPVGTLYVFFDFSTFFLDNDQVL